MRISSASYGSGVFITIIFVAAVRGEVLSGGHKLCSRFVVHTFLTVLFFFFSPPLLLQFSFTLAMLRDGSAAHKVREALRKTLVNEMRVCSLVRGPCSTL